MDPSQGDIASLFFGDDETTAQNAMRMAAALRGQQELGQLGQMTGNKTLVNVGTSMLQGVGDKEGLIAKAGSQIKQRQLQLAMAKQEQDAAARRQQESDRAAMQRTQAGIDAGKFVFTPYGAGNARDGSFTPFAPGEGKAPAGSLTEKDFQAGLEKLRQNTSPFGGKASLLPKYQGRIDAAAQLEALFKSPEGKPINATPQQKREGAMALASLISQGKVTEAQVEALDPDTFASHWANIKQKVLNEPQGADAQAFLQNMLDTAARETNIARGALRKSQLAAIPASWTMRAHNPAAFDAVLRGNLGSDFDPGTLDENGLPKAVQAAAAHPQADAAAQWAAANPNDPRAKAILAKLNGGL